MSYNIWLFLYFEKIVLTSFIFNKPAVQRSSSCRPVQTESVEKERRWRKTWDNIKYYNVFCFLCNDDIVWIVCVDGCVAVYVYTVCAMYIFLIQFGNLGTLEPIVPSVAWRPWIKNKCQVKVCAGIRITRDERISAISPRVNSANKLVSYFFFFFAPHFHYGFFFSISIAFSTALRLGENTITQERAFVRLHVIPAAAVFVKRVRLIACRVYGNGLELLY